VEDYGTMKSLRRLAFVLCLLPVACERPPTALPTAKAGGEGRVKWVDPKTIQPGPIRRDSLTDEQMARIRALQATFVEVDRQTVDQWVDNFKRDADPDKELRIWERMSKAFRAYCDGRKLSPEAKKDVFSVVLLRSMASEPEVLKHVKLKTLSRDDAIAVMKGY
jgi:hypothetical protein